ncbi:hypothetical protein GQX74_014283 [Glossina fuscipes]|nr:hypothetical protein GQX74_014283 [Glossina fuscipes]
MKRKKGDVSSNIFHESYTDTEMELPLILRILGGFKVFKVLANQLGTSNKCKWLQKRDNKLLSEINSKDEIFVRSTDVDRTLMGSLRNLAGLYQPEASDVWNPDVNWQPIPVHMMPEFAYLFNYLSKYTGRSMNSLEDLQSFNNILYIEGLYNKTLPEWTKKVYPSPDLHFISDSTFTIGTYNRYMARLKTGPLIKGILQRFTDKVKDKLYPDREIWMYTAHDTAIANVLNTLKLFNGTQYQQQLNMQRIVTEYMCKILILGEKIKNCRQKTIAAALLLQFRLFQLQQRGVKCGLVPLCGLRRRLIPLELIYRTMENI